MRDCLPLAAGLRPKAKNTRKAARRAAVHSAGLLIGRVARGALVRLPNRQRVDSEFSTWVGRSSTLDAEWRARHRRVGRCDQPAGTRCARGHVSRWTRRRFPRNSAELSGLHVNVLIKKAQVSVRFRQFVCACTPQQMFRQRRQMFSRHGRLLAKRATL